MSDVASKRTLALRDRLIEKAESDPALIAFAINVWRKSMETSPEVVLGCDHADLWKIGLIRAPADGPQFANDVHRIATTFNVSEVALIDLIRLGQVSKQLREANKNGMLQAARAFDPGPDKL